MTYYTKCDDLPLYNFIKAVVHGDFTWLIKDREPNEMPDKDYLAILWESITTEYNNCSGDITSSHAFNLRKDITILNDKMSLVQMTVSFLTKHYSDELCEVLRSMGFFYDFTTETLYSDLKMTISECKTMLDELKEYEREYLEIIQINEDNKPTEQGYAKILAQLSKYMGFRIDPKLATVLEFLEYISLSRVEENGR